MGVERAVTRWYVQRQTVQDEITAQQTRLEQLRSENQHILERAEAERQLAVAQARLLHLGPCPKPMMG